MPSPSDRPRAALALCALLVVVHVATAQAHPSFWEGLYVERPAAVRVLAGGQHQGLVAMHGYWRLFTSVLLHVGAVHLLVNCLGLYVLGQLLEGRVGVVRWLEAFLLGGLGGSLASQLAGVRMSDGASGGAFALLGAALVWGWLHREVLDEEEQRIFGPVLGGFLALNVVLSLLPFVDAFGHLGGLVAGVGIASTWRAEQTAAWERALLGLLLLAYLGAAVYGWVLR